MSEVATRSGRIHYAAAGELGPIGPIVLLHGSGMALTSYDYVLPGLAAVTRVYAIDSPGHGESERPPGDDPFPVERFTDAMLDVLDGLGLSRVNLVGNSLGAMTAVDVAATYPDRVRKLVLVGCPGWDGRWRAERMEERRRNPIPRPSLDTPLTPADLAAEFTAPTEELAARVTLARRQSAAFAEQRSMAVMTHDTLGRSFEVQAPTLLLCGERDIVVPDQPKFLRAIPDSRLVILDNCAHYPQVDDPARFVRTVLDFLGD
jgi:2-hydroxy-6-oxonona-2,4-dienedioate hydrolase